MAEIDDGADALVARALAASDLGRLPPQRAKELLAGAIRTEVPAGRILYRAGDHPLPSLVVTGVFRQFVTGPYDRQASVFYARSGDLLGFSQVVDDVSPVGCQALTVGYLLRFEVSTMATIAATEPELALALTRQAVARLCRLVVEMRNDAFGSVRERVARHLLDLAHEAQPTGALVASVSCQQLADAVGSVREVVGTVVAGMRREGLVDRVKHGIAILEPERLRSEGWAED